jgi:hypothetical protein
VETEPSFSAHPSLILQTINFPVGVDIQSQYETDYGAHPDSGNATSDINRSVYLTFKPGNWYTPLQWFSPRVGITQTIGSLFDNASSTIDRIFIGGGEIKTSSITRRAGVYLYPNSNVIFRNDNSWTDSDTLQKFQTFNDLKIWMSGQALWQTRYEYTGTVSASNQRAYTQLDKMWNARFRSTQGLFGTVNDDSAGTTVSIGPRIMASLNLPSMGFLKVFVNSHSLSCMWDKTASGFKVMPLINYTFYLQTILLPNISIENSEIIGINEKGIKDLIASLELKALF